MDVLLNGHRPGMENEASRLILLLALSDLLTQEIERPEHRQLTNERFKTDLRAFTARVEAEVDARAGRRHLHLAGADESPVGDD